ncbi:NineTeen Complex (NTC) component [Coemansia sp. Benny D115]|nr:NineTeen Complex (NTC) component [Coemansia sp. Benny D115]
MKAQSMLYRFREAQSLERGILPTKERRPHDPTQTTQVDQAEKWRLDVIREISRTVSKIQDASVPEPQIRDLNDQINRLLRTKDRWETRIKELGGPDYQSSADGGSGHRGYRYFGRAKDLQDVRQLMEQRKKPKSQGDGRAVMLKRADAMYYGYMDENDDGELLEYERQETERRRKLMERSEGHVLEFNSDSAESSSDEDTHTAA